MFAFFDTSLADATQPPLPLHLTSWDVRIWNWFVGWCSPLCDLRGSPMLHNYISSLHVCVPKMTVTGRTKQTVASVMGRCEEGERRKCKRLSSLILFSTILNHNFQVLQNIKLKFLNIWNVISCHEARQQWQWFYTIYQSRWQGQECHYFIV